MLPALRRCWRAQLAGGDRGPRCWRLLGRRIRRARTLRRRSRRSRSKSRRTPRSIRSRHDDGGAFLSDSEKRPPFATSRAPSILFRAMLRNARRRGRGGGGGATRARTQAGPRAEGGEAQGGEASGGRGPYHEGGGGGVSLRPAPVRRPEATMDGSITIKQREKRNARSYQKNIHTRSTRMKRNNVKTMQQKQAKKRWNNKRKRKRSRKRRRGT